MHTVNSKSSVYFRVDGNSLIGLGHIYRAVSIVNMLKDIFDCYLITKTSTPVESISNDFSGIFILPESLSIKDEHRWIANKIPHQSLIIIDGYDFTNEYFQKLKEYSFKIIYIDDLLSDMNAVDAVVNHHPSVKPSDYSISKNAKTKFYLGSSYTMLRPAFLNYAQKKDSIDVVGNNIFVCFGGTDVNNLSYRITKKLIELSCIDKINLIVGAAYKDQESIKELTRNHKVNLFQNLSEYDLLDVLINSSIAIVPASTILLEACAINMPIITTTIADNQIKTYNFFVENDLVYGIDDNNTLDHQLTCELLLRLLDKRDYYISRQKNIIDGKSKERFINLIKEIL